MNRWIDNGEYLAVAVTLYIKEEWAVQNVSSTHIAAHPENATKCYVLRNIYSCDWIKKWGCIENCVCRKEQEVTVQGK